MTFLELKQAGERLTDKQRAAQLRLLLRDPRAVALVGWLESHRAQWEGAVASQALAGNPAKQGHAAGSLYALRLLLAQVCGLVEKTSEPAREEPPPEEG